MRRICWDQNLVRQVFTTEADTRLTKESFLRLHRPFDRIRIVAAKPYTFPQGSVKSEGAEQFIHEQGLLTALQAAALDAPNRIFVLTGEPGSGKSHLARWLYHMLEADPGRFAIHVPRRINKLVEVLQHLADVAGMRLEQAPSSYLLEAPPMKVVRYLCSYLDMAVGTGTPLSAQFPLLGRLVTRPELEAILAHQVARYQAVHRQGVTNGTDLIQIPEDDFARLAPGGTLTERTEAYAVLRRHLTDALLKLTNLDRFDLKAELARVAAAMVQQGRRPVLILEDITSFDLLHDDLLTFLLDEAAGHFDALVCWTTGYEKAYLRTYQLDRYAARLSLSDSEMEVYALKGGGYREMVRAYLDAVKPWCRPGVCDLYERCTAAFAGLYPLTPEALERIYQNLIGTDQQQRKTPRNLLDRAVKGYLELAEGNGAFPPITQPPVVREILYPERLFRFRESHPAFVALAAWYGREQQGMLRLNDDVPRLLGIHVPPQFETTDGVRIGLDEADDGEAFLGADSGLISRDASTPAGDFEPAHAVDGYYTDTTGLSQHPEPPPLAAQQVKGQGHQVEEINKLKELRLEAQTWTASLRVPSRVHELYRGVFRLLVLFKYRLPVSLGHPEGPLTGLSYGKQQPDANVTAEGTRNKLTPLHQFMLYTVDPVARERGMEIWTAALQLQVTGQLPEGADLAFLAHWCATRYARYRSEVKCALEDTLGMSLEEWALAAHWLLLAARAGQTAPRLVDLVWADLPESLPADLVLSSVNELELRRGLEQTRILIDGVFSLAKGFYDRAKLDKALGGLHPDRFLPILAGVAHTKIESDYRIGGVYPFADLVRLVKQVAIAFLKEEVGDRIVKAEAEVRDVLRGLEGGPMELQRAVGDLRRLIGLTERYDLYDAALWQAWENGWPALAGARERSGELAALISPTVQPVEASRPAGLSAYSHTEGVWEYVALAGRVAALRANPGMRAAAAVAAIADRLTVGLNLEGSEAGSVSEALQAAVVALRRSLPAGRFTPELALWVLEQALREADPKVREALEHIRAALERLMPVGSGSAGV